VDGTFEKGFTMSAALDLTDQQFGKLTVLGLSHKRDRTGRRSSPRTRPRSCLWTCRCECGRKTVLSTSALQGGRKACGCLRGKLSHANEIFPVERGELTWQDAHTFRDKAGNEFVTFAGAKAAGIQHPDRVWPNKRKRVAPPYPRKCKRTWAVPAKDVHAKKTLADGMKDGRETFVDENGQRYLTESQAKHFHGTTRGFCRLWHNKRSKLRPNQSALPSRPVPNPLGRGPALVNGFLEAALLDILSGKEGKAPGTGTGVNANWHRQDKLAKALKALPVILPNGERMAPSDVLARAKSEYDLSPPYVNKAFALLRGRSDSAGRKGAAGKCYWWELPASAYDLNAGKATPATRDAPRPQSAAQTATVKRPPGRPEGSISPDVARRKKEMLEAWDRGEYESKAAAARAHGFHRPDASKIIDEHEAGNA
jgi:hypothetical protein